VFSVVNKDSSDYSEYLSEIILTEVMFARLLHLAEQLPTDFVFKRIYNTRTNRWIR